MKKAIVIILLTIGAVGLRAQGLKPLVAEGKQWNVVYTYAPWPPVNRVTDAYKMEGDTMVEGAAYKKLFSTRSEHFTNWELCGVLRETEEGRVFHRKYNWNHTFGEEHILYDFTLQPGDSICYNSTDRLMLLSVDDIVLEDGSVRKRYYFQYYCGWWMDEYETWIEGMGSNLGLVNPGSRFLVGGEYDLLCYYEDDDLVWQHPVFNSCYLGSDGLDENETAAPVSVYPNPTTGRVTVTGENLQRADVINILGQRVLSIQGKGDELQLDLSRLPAGVYTLRVTMEDGSVYSDKVVKE